MIDVGELDGVWVALDLEGETPVVVLEGPSISSSPFGVQSVGTVLFSYCGRTAGDGWTPRGYRLRVPLTPAADSRVVRLVDMIAEIRRRAGLVQLPLPEEMYPADGELDAATVARVTQAVNGE